MRLILAKYGAFYEKNLRGGKKCSNFATAIGKRGGTAMKAGA